MPGTSKRMHKVSSVIMKRRGNILEDRKHALGWEHTVTDAQTKDPVALSRSSDASVCFVLLVGCQPVNALIQGKLTVRPDSNIKPIVCGYSCGTPTATSSRSLVAISSRVPSRLVVYRLGWLFA